MKLRIAIASGSANGTFAKVDRNKGTASLAKSANSTHACHFLQLLQPLISESKITELFPAATTSLLPNLKLNEANVVSEEK